MTPTMWFPLGVAVLEAGAAVVHAYHGQWGLAVAWGAYAVACVGLAFS